MGKTDQAGTRRKPRKPRVLLLNPPGDRTYLRDYYCSSISKSGYYWHPIDLLVLSARLDGAGCPLAVVDAMAEGLSLDASLERIVRWEPDVVVFLTGATSWGRDRPFLERVARKTGARMLGCGEIFLGNPARLFRENGWMEAGIRDFTDPGILGFLSAGEPCPGLVDRGRARAEEEPSAHAMPGASGGGTGVTQGKGATRGPAGKGGNTRGAAGRLLSYGVPRHELFPLKRYRYPYHRHHPFASVLTAYGCPFRCRFCNSGYLGFRLRDMGDISRELDHVRGLGIRQLFVKDMSFGAPADHAREFCGLLSRPGISMSWNCYARLDSLEVPLLESMRRAGCHLVQMGLETANPDVGRSMGKELDTDKALEIFRACRRLGIRTGAHFVLGLPGETERGVRETMELACRLNPDYGSFNLFMPRHGSPLGHLLDPGTDDGAPPSVLDPSETFPSRSFCDLDPAGLFRWRSRAYRAFYLRPGYLLRQGFRWRTRTELAGIVLDAWGLARNLLRLSAMRGGDNQAAGHGPADR